MLMLQNVATRELFEQEMMRERMREFPGMGQTFYALKHYNRSFTDFRNIDTYQPLMQYSNSHGLTERTNMATKKYINFRTKHQDK